jgi:hypothetical protein
MLFPLSLVPTSTQDLFYLPVLNFFKKTFLFVYNSYTGSFIVTFPYVCIFPKLVHPFCSFYYSPFCLSNFLMVISTDLYVPCLYLYFVPFYFVHVKNFCILFMLIFYCTYFIMFLPYVSFLHTA